MVQLTLQTDDSDRTGELTLDVALTSEGLILGGQGPLRNTLVTIPLPLDTGSKPPCAAWSSAKMVSLRVVSLRELKPNVVEVLMKAFIVATETEAQGTVAALAPPEMPLPDTPPE
jgi:hypothetical protein